MGKFFILSFLSLFPATVGSKACLPMPYFEGRGHDLPEQAQPSFETWTWACVVHSQALCAWSLQISHRPVSLLPVLMKLWVPSSKLFELLRNISFPCLLLCLSTVGTLASGKSLIVITWSAITVNQLSHPHHPLWEKEQQSGRLISGTGQVFKEWPCTWLPGMRLAELPSDHFPLTFASWNFPLGGLRLERSHYIPSVEEE